MITTMIKIVIITHIPPNKTPIETQIPISIQFVLIVLDSDIVAVTECACRLKLNPKYYDATPCIVLYCLRVDACRNIT